MGKKMWLYNAFEKFDSDMESRDRICMSVRPHHSNTKVKTQSTGTATRMQLEVSLAGIRMGTRLL